MIYFRTVLVCRQQTILCYIYVLLFFALEIFWDNMTMSRGVHRWSVADQLGDPCALENRSNSVVTFATYLYWIWFVAVSWYIYIYIHIIYMYIYIYIYSYYIYTHIILYIYMSSMFHSHDWTSSSSHCPAKIQVNFMGKRLKDVCSEFDEQNDLIGPVATWCHGSHGSKLRVGFRLIVSDA